MKIIALLKNFSYTIVSNLVQLVISTLLVIIIPKVVDTREYGLFQIFLLYVAYVGIAHFGWLDGIYLRYGGAEYEKLDKKKFHQQFILFSLMMIFFAVVMVLISLFPSFESSRFLLCSLAIAVVIQNMQTFFWYILQATNRIKEYAISNFLNPFIYACGVLLSLALGFRNYEFFVGSYLIGVAISTVYAMLQCKEILFLKHFSLDFSFEEVKENIQVGIKLVLSNFSGMLVLGIIRMGIERGWNVETFGKISLTLGISNLLMIFVGAIGVVLFPMLRRIDVKNMTTIYSSIRHILMITLLVGTLVYFPIDYIIPKWLPKFKEALVYMSVMFPMVIYQGKFSLLSNTFMKTLRMEKQLLIVNIATLVCSVFLTIVSVSVFHNLTMTIFSIILVFAFRSTFSEIYMKQKLEINVAGELIIETVMVAGFIGVTWFFPPYISLPTYIVMLIVYILVKKDEIKESIQVFNK
ncbi:Membrane protein involved in the export of O-antigen and teichoic acid [Pilibacter termitis]|uniref:Membrane protein involved in the export of O-antigen and teichoic acid n=1 Tax=Pilibacter termitis TaxID=263852 RepID=A0A1T4P3V6_9ENTE|nr:oligosaccharide flippase family protein [Pilibacter termitis]SJZ86081.1 Membrane protein involved in the export of O-antigen and teichoic acid [Pilibacter termitis]